jgi:hypothetical protein
MNDERHDIPPDLLDVAHALTEHRPRMSGPQLARVRERAIGSGSRTATAPRGGFMRSRIAIIALLASGALMSSGGAALGVSALSTTTDASQAQYGPVTPTTPASDLSPSANTLANADDTDVTPARSGVKDATDESNATATAQPARQLEAAGNDELPFTGYAAIPLLLVGLLLLVAGLVLRRGTSTDGSQLR